MLVTDNKRIAKNTLYLYFRMFLIMAVTLYTSRIYLQVLGETDFGIYNIVGGVIVLLSFVSNSMSTSTQRFLNYEMGKGNRARLEKIFSSSMIVYIIFSLVFLVIGETLGLWFLNTQMNIPPERMSAANVVYQFTLIGFITNLLRVPYNATIIANEKMNFYAYFSIIEVGLKLGIAFVLLMWVDVDKLIILSLLSCIIFIIITLIYKIYCNRHFVSSRFHYVWDKVILKQLLSFSGWSLLGSASNMGASQGVNIILNIFCGVSVNAAVGMATQLINGLNQLCGNFQLALTPQLVKLHALGRKDEFMNLVFRSSRFSYYLLLLLAIPAMFCMDFILSVWLDIVPQYTADFCRLILLFSLIDAISAPLWLSVQAVGNIRNYQIIMSLLIVLNLPLAYWALKEGLSPLSVWGIRVMINGIIYIVRIFYLKGLLQLPVLRYLKEVVLSSLVVTLLTIPIPFLLNGMYSGWLNLGIITFTSAAIMLIMVYVFGLNKGERLFIQNSIKKKCVNE